MGRFTYGRSYLALPDAVPIDPIMLPLQAREYETSHLSGWFAALLDSGPDAWGKRIIDRRVGPQDQRGYLLHARGQPVGALTFSERRDTPPAQTATSQVHTLEETLALHKRVELGQSLTAEEADKLLGEAGSGGARPKLTVEDEGALWLVKSVSVKDKEDFAPVPLVEATLLRLASELDIRAPRTRLESIAGTPVLMVERFDRQRTARGYSRWRYASAQTL
ncbi:MAG: HipA domain-containing protein, partial [Variovorax sp.]